MPPARMQILLGIASLLIVACAQKKDPAPAAEMSAMSGMSEAAVLVDTTVELSKLRFPGGQLSLNDRCPVRRGRLNPKMPPVYVNGQPVGFC